MSELPSKVLVVDQDASVSNGITNNLMRQKINVQKAIDGNSALYLYEQTRFDCAILEQALEDVPGLALIQKWRKNADEGRRTTGMMIFQSGSFSAEASALLKELGDIEIVKKPINHPQLLSLLAKAYNNKKRAILYETIATEAYQTLEKSGLQEALSTVRSHLSQIGQRALNLMVDLYIRAENYQDALQLVTGQLSKDPDNPRLLNLQAQLEYHLGHYDVSVSIMEKLHKNAPGQLQRMSTMAESYIQLSSPEQSVKLFTQLIGHTPEVPDYKFEAIGKLQRAGFHDQAKELGQNTATPMEIVRYYNNRGVEMSKNGDTQQALNEYETALSFFPKFKENYRIYYNMALAYKGRKTRQDFEEARTCLKRCLELSPAYDKGIKTMEVITNALNAKKKTS
ncbi:MAG: tetratricopeptide repeat protein [Oligoflexales bacterium]